MIMAGMTPHGSGSTLRIKRPFGRVVILALALSVLAGGLAEAAARQPDVQARLISPMTSGHNQLGMKIQLLEQYVWREGGLDCVIVGSSIADTSLDPDALSEAYRRKTGQSLRCFNLGLSAVDHHAAAGVAAYAMRFHPWLVIYAANYVDFGNPYSRDLSVSPLIRLAQGQFSPEGWLETNSHSYRYLLAYRIKAESVEIDPVPPGFAGYSPSGYGLFTPVFDQAADPIRVDTLERTPLINIHTDDLGGLAHLGELARSGIQVVILNTPFPPRMVEILPLRQSSYDTYVDVVRVESVKRGLLFAPGDQVPIPDDGWGNANHLNVTGARVFSAWVGEWLAASLEDR